MDVENGGIPVNIGDLPTELPTLDTSTVYRVMLNKAALSPKPDKRGSVYAQLQIEVADGDNEGYPLNVNYLALPVPITEDMTRGERTRAQIKSIPFARFCAAFRIGGKMPSVDLSDPDSMTRWVEWMEQFYGNTARVTVRDNEFPVGSGKMRSEINDYIAG